MPESFPQEDAEIRDEYVVRLPDAPSGRGGESDKGVIELAGYPGELRAGEEVKLVRIVHSAKTDPYRLPPDGLDSVD